MMQMESNGSNFLCLSESQAPLSVPPFLHKSNYQQQPAILRGRQQWLKKGYQVVPVNLQKRLVILSLFAFDWKYVVLSS